MTAIEGTTREIALASAGLFEEFRTIRPGGHVDRWDLEESARKAADEMGWKAERRLCLAWGPLDD